MKIIVIGDIHAETTSCSHSSFVDADVIVINGDLTNFGGKQQAKSVIDTFRSTNPNIIAQLGNLDTLEVDEWLESEEINLNGQARLLDGCCLVGLGGSNPTPFNTPGECTENDLAANAQKAFAMADTLVDGRIIPLIFISHAPPLNTALDKISSGMHVGSMAVREAIERYRPALCVSGHIHEAKGEDVLDGIPLYNPGVFAAGGYVEIICKNGEIRAGVQQIL